MEDRLPEPEAVYMDERLVVCVKPPKVLSTDEPGGLPELLAKKLGLPPGELRTVHRLDRATSGLMVLARDKEAASHISRQIRQGETGKEYLAMVHGQSGPGGRLEDLMYRDKARKMSFIVREPGKGVQQALLDYETLWQGEGMSLVRIELITGRTHQIRCQFASRGLPLVGERKYAALEDPCPLALFAYRLSFRHPEGDRPMSFTRYPEPGWPWSLAGEKLKLETSSLKVNRS